MPRSLAPLAVAALLAGCGAPPQAPDPAGVPAAGVVRLDGKPLPFASLTFLPDGDAPGSGGGGSADAEGRYAVFDRRGNAGLPPGTYRVAVSLRKKPDGTVVHQNVAEAIDPLESAESLPPWYSQPDATVLKVTIAPDGTKGDIDLSSSKTKPRK